MKWTLIAVAGVVAALLLVFGGFLLALHPVVGDALRGVLPSSLSGESGSGIDYELQQEVLGKLESGYYTEIDPESLEGGAVEGMVAGLDDPYTYYMGPEEYAAYLDRLSGEYSGVGMVVEMKNSLIFIVSTLKDSPAQAAGIRPGDIILSVDGESTDGQGLHEVVNKITGTEGTTVTLEMYRPPVPTTTTTTAGEGSGAATGGSTVDLTQVPLGGEVSEYTLTRQTLARPVTESEILEAGDEEVAYIIFSTFSKGSAEQLRSQVQKAIETDHVDAIILDLRSNGGGILGEAVDVASIFIPSGTIVSYEGLHSEERVYSANGDALPELPLYVLTNPYTASASEIVSGALQDYGRATLVGDTTFGKGLVQIIEPLSNGGALKLTSAVYLTPKGRYINKTGIDPDVVAPDDPETADTDETLQEALDLISSTTASR